MWEQNKAVVRRMVENHWNAKDVTLAGDLFSASVSLQTPDGALTGLEGAMFLLQAYAAAFPDFRIAIDDMIAEEDVVVLRWTFTGTNRGQLGELGATGKPVSVPNCMGVFRLAGGKIVEGHMAWDRLELRQQLGLLPGSGAVQA